MENNLPRLDALRPERAVRNIIVSCGLLASICLILDTILPIFRHPRKRQGQDQAKLRHFREETVATLHQIKGKNAAAQKAAAV